MRSYRLKGKWWRGACVGSVISDVIGNGGNILVYCPPFRVWGRTSATIASVFVHAASAQRHICKEKLHIQRDGAMISGEQMSDKGAVEVMLLAN